MRVSYVSDFTFHVYSRPEGVAAVMICDKEYPKLPAHSVLSKLLDEFLVKNPKLDADAPRDLPDLKAYMRDCQNPENVDSIMKIQKELDETKIILHNTIESVGLVFFFYSILPLFTSPPSPFSFG